MKTTAPFPASTTATVSTADIAAQNWLLEHGKTGMLLVLVPGGKFLAGENPAFEVELPSYYLGLHPVTNGQYGRFVKESGHRAPDNQFWQQVSKADHPVTNVSWEDAQAYCRWAGLRLPGELEWEKAARGTDGRKYPWGEEWDQSKCRNSNNKGNETTAGVWDYALGASPYGAYQLSGNVWEFCEDWYDEKAYERYRQGDMIPPSSGQYRVLRGGSWRNDDPDNFSAFYRYLSYPGPRRDGDGFRCGLSLGVSPGAGLRIP